MHVCMYVNDNIYAKRNGQQVHTKAYAVRSKSSSLHSSNFIVLDSTIQKSH